MNKELERIDMPNVHVVGWWSESHELYGYAYAEIREKNDYDIKSGIGNNEKYLGSEALSGEAIAILQATDYAIAKGYEKVAIIVSDTCFEEWLGSIKKDRLPIAKSFNYLMHKKFSEIDVLLVPAKTWGDLDTIKRLRKIAEKKELNN